MNPVVELPERIETVPKMDWTNVRRIYRQLSKNFHILTEPFGIYLTEELDLYLAHLIGAIDVVDRELDELDDCRKRAQLSAVILNFLESGGEESQLPNTSDELDERLIILRQIINRRNVRELFCTTVARILHLAEAKRQAETESALIGLLASEWRLTGHLPVLILGDRSNPAFEAFFYLLCEMMLAVDTLQDARSDFESGKTRVRPRVRFYLRLLSVLAVPLPGLLWRFPRPLQLIRYAAAFR